MTLETDPRSNSGRFLTVEQCSELAGMLDRKYAAFMNERWFEIEASRDRVGVSLKVTLRNATGSYYYPVEGRICYVDHDMSAYDAGIMVLDYIDAYFDEYLREGGGVYLPIDWADYEIDGVPLQLRGQILNLEIERLGDLWLEGRAPGQEASSHAGSKAHAPHSEGDAATRH